MDHAAVPPAQPSFADLPAEVKKRFPILEACLFAAGHPLTYGCLGQVLHCSSRECRDTAEKMAALYLADDPFPRGICLLLYPDACQLCTKEQYGEAVRKALGVRRTARLSPSLLESLAVIAYHQPATRAFVDQIRGVDSAYAISTLLDKNLIEVCGTLDVPGRPALYATTTEFLRVFGLSDLSELPAVTLSEPPLPDAAPNDPPMT